MYWYLISSASLIFALQFKVIKVRKKLTSPLLLARCSPWNYWQARSTILSMQLWGNSNSQGIVNNPLKWPWCRPLSAAVSVYSPIVLAVGCVCSKVLTSISPDVTKFIGVHTCTRHQLNSNSCCPWKACTVELNYFHSAFKNQWLLSDWSGNSKYWSTLTWSSIKYLKTKSVL